MHSKSVRKKLGYGIFFLIKRCPILLLLSANACKIVKRQNHSSESESPLIPVWRGLASTLRSNTPTPVLRRALLRRMEWRTGLQPALTRVDTDSGKSVAVVARASRPCVFGGQQPDAGCNARARRPCHLLFDRGYAGTPHAGLWRLRSATE